MEYDVNPDAPILVAAPDEWRDELAGYFMERGYKLLTAQTRDEARKIIQSETLSGLIVVSTWALSSEDGNILGLIEHVKGKIPSVTLIKNRKGYERLDELYINPHHQYCSVPFSIEEIIAWMDKANMKPIKKNRVKNDNEMVNTYSQTWFELFMETQLYTKQEAAFLIRNLPRPPYQKILDVCCGPGRHSSPLSKQGYQIVGIDLDQAALAKARKNAAENATFLHKDMRRLEEVPGRFDAVLSMWQSFGYFDEATNRDVLRQMSEKLRRDGRLILDIYNRDFYERNQGTQQLERNGVTITATNTMMGSRLRATLDYGNGGDVFEWQLFRPDEIVEVAAEYGLELMLMCTECDEQKLVSPEKPRMNLVFVRGIQ